MRRAGVLLVALVVLGGCIFRSSDPPRFFRPGSTTLETTAADGVSRPAPDAIAVRLRGVRSEPFLRERIVWRASAVEYGLYEERRWIDLPAHYVERALRTRLASTPGLRLTSDPHAPALHVDVLAFDEVLGPTHVADVTLAVVLEDPLAGRLLGRTFEAQRDIADGDPGTMAKAMGEALDDAVAQVADAVRLSVRPHRAGAR